MKIDFTKFPIYEGIKKEMRVANDMTFFFGNSIYNNMPGIDAHVLAEKIYQSTEDGVELTDREVKLLRNLASMLPGVFADSINDHLNELQNKEG